MGVYLRGFLK